MKVVDHPYLAGVRLREDGACFIPTSGVHKAHWTFGSAKSARGYLQVQVAGKNYRVHRLMAEAFLRCPIPAGMQIDHIDRCPSNNKLGNIRIVTPSENARNRGVNEASFRKYGVVAADDKAAYDRARYAADPEFREKKRAYMKAYDAKKRAKAAL